MESNTNSPIILKINNVHKSFGTNHVHTGVTFNLKRGETLGLLGGSGTGKSVLLRSIIGLEHIDKGEIYFNDQRIDQLKENEYLKTRTKISYSFQSGALFDSKSVFENLAYPLYEHTKLSFDEISVKVNEMLNIIGLPNKGDLMPSDLSGGMQKRVGMGRAIILNPDIVLYDEPTAGLDPINTVNILNLMQKLKSTGISSIFVTHDIPAAIKICNKIVILDKGKIAIEGTPDELVKSNNPIVKNFFLSESHNNKEVPEI
ncbi:MAG: ATP-binding cassette domain-containing protein [Bacteriovoracaceae bacterium]